MRARDLLELQLNGSFNLLAERLEKTTDVEWTRRAIPGTNLVGFILWHGVRTIDWAVHTAVRGVPEVAAAARWAGRLQQQHAYGSGITLEEADAAARGVGREVVREYLSDVRGSVIVQNDGSGSIEVNKVGKDFRVESKGSGSIDYADVSGRIDSTRRSMAHP